jgi:CubicO group peptidase (beta-lactamase class C family)
MRHFLIGILLCQLVFLAACDEEKEAEVIAPPAAVKDSVFMYFPTDNVTAWETVEAAKLGWRENYLQQAIDYAKQKNSYSLLILYKGRIVSENYWLDSNQESQHPVESVSKSMMSFQLGILQEEGKLKITEPVSSYIGDGWSKAPLKKEKQITLEHLMTMTSGLDYELNYLSDPGEIWYYSHAAFTTLFKVVEAVTEQSFEEVFEQNLFSKIQSSNYTWHGTDLAMTARDMARFGLLIQNNGMWNKQKLLQDDGYFQEMLSSSQTLQKAYGYLWWLNGQSDYIDKAGEDQVIPGPIYPAMPGDAKLAMGHFDQRIEVIPSLDLIIIRQGGDTGLPELGEQSFDNEFWTLLMKAIKNQEIG